MHKTDPYLEGLKERAWPEVSAIDRALAEGHIDEEGWHAAVAALIKPAYLSGENAYAQAGHSGNSETWEASRGIIANAIDRNGTVLDVGCASGILMETLNAWCARKDVVIEPHGLEIVPELAALARQRLPQWVDRIHVGNIRNWRPIEHRFDFVVIRPEYAPPDRRAEMVRHILREVVAPGGRLIVFVGNEEAKLRNAEARMTTKVDGRIEIPHPKDARLVRRLFWIDER